VKSLWHHSRQQKTDRPIDSAELRRLVGNGLIQPTDRIRRSGSKRWVKAAKVEGLFNAHEPQWYISRRQKLQGPVTLEALRNLARIGDLRPNDFIWKQGMRRCKRARKIVGLFPVAHAPADDPAAQTHPIPDSRVLWRRPVVAVAAALALGILVPGLAIATLRAGRTAPRTPLVAAARVVEKPGRAGRPDRGGPERVARPIVPETPAPATPPARTRGEVERPRASLDTGTPGPEATARVGRAVHELILRFHEAEDDPKLRERLARMAAPLRRPGRGEGPTPAVVFTILRSEEVFTFSHPGNYVYVSRGLFSFVRNDVELQFQIARELAHLEHNHLASAAGAAGATAPAPGIERQLYRQIALGYTDDQVFAADAQAFLTLLELGHPAHRLRSWLSPAYDFNGEADLRGSRRKPKPGAPDGRQEIENHWHAQPPAPARYERLRSLELTRARSSTPQPG
jgi:hypothetical protein